MRRVKTFEFDDQRFCRSLDVLENNSVNVAAFVKQTNRQVRRLLERAKNGYASIYADIRDGRKTEVDMISGAVVSASRRNHVPAPSHEFVVGLIHAMEDKGIVQAL